MHKAGLIMSLMMVVSVSAIADDLKPYRFDSMQMNLGALFFDRADRMRPAKSDFKVNRSVAMSNDDGHRAVILSLENLSSGRRILEPEQLMVIYADGTALRVNALPKKILLEGYEKRNFTLELGENDYPVVAVVAANNEGY
ncbi:MULTISPECIES: hypothetical protein [Pseudoalteromonas]|uniref:hypothetical protein n=1 Tax=Pseudoalteromonas TaxID=53246 RepID=UPI000F77097C|nr:MULTISPECIES: hypothetical protein [Pseudoalteromonas]MCG7559991.1 hypothetical protein [Pseudoalteromonas sp. McH1-42]MEC4089073.1 hypothetical protein [Pseudoalteromonas rubra]